MRKLNETQKVHIAFLAVALLFLIPATIFQDTGLLRIAGAFIIIGNVIAIAGWNSK